MKTFSLPTSRSLFPASLLALFLSANAFSEDWSRFRGPNGTGRASTADDLPESWANDRGIVWKTPILRGSSSPVITNERIFITGYSGYAENATDPGSKSDLTLHVSAYDAKSGEQIWDFPFKASESEQQATKRVIDHGYASPTPCTDGDKVFATFGPSGVVALDVEGKLLWRQDVGDGKAGFGAASSPIEFDDLVIVNASIESKTLYALDKDSGKIRWKVADIERAWTTPALVKLEGGSVELVIHFKDHVRGLEPKTGKELWRCEGIPDYIVPVPVVDGETIYFSGGRQNRTIAIKAGGRGDVTETHKLWEVNRGANVTTPLFHDGHLYWSHDKAFAQAMSAADGTMLYQERFKNRDRVYASVIYGDGKLFMTQRDGNTLVLAAKPEYEELAVNQLGTDDEQFNATPAIYQNSLIFRSTRMLYRIGKTE